MKWFRCLPATRDKPLACDSVTEGLALLPVKVVRGAVLIIENVGSLFVQWGRLCEGVWLPVLALYHELFVHVLRRMS